MNRRSAAYVLLALAAAVFWWRQRVAAGATSLSDAVVAQYKDLLGMVKPAQINERTLADGIPDAANALNSAGLAGYLTGAEGTFIIAPPGELAGAITASKTPVLPAPAKKQTTTQYYYWPGFGTASSSLPFWSEKKLQWPVLKTREA